MADGKKNLGKGTTFNLSTREGKGQVDLEPVLIFFLRKQIPQNTPNKIAHILLRFVQSIIKFILSSILKELKIKKKNLNILFWDTCKPQYKCEVQRTICRSQLSPEFQKVTSGCGCHAWQQEGPLPTVNHFSCPKNLQVFKET